MTVKEEKQRKRRRANLTLSDETRALLDELAKRLGISKSAIVDEAVGELAKRHRVKVPKRK